MLLEGISEAIEQCFPLPAVVRLLFTERRQSLACSQLIQPASPPRATFKHPMQIGACHIPSSLADGSHPAKLSIKAQRLAGFRFFAGGAAMVELKSFEFESAASSGPSGHTAALPERLVSGKHGTKRQEAEACMAVVDRWSTAFQTLRIAKLLAQHLHAAADAKHMATAGAVGLKSCAQATAVNGGKVTERLFAAWDHNGIWQAKFLAWGDPAQLNRGLGFQWIEVREVAEGQQLEHNNLEFGAAFAPASLEEVEGILRRE